MICDFFIQKIRFTSLQTKPRSVEWEKIRKFPGQSENSPAFTARYQKGRRQGGCENVCFRNFAKFLISCFAKFSTNFAKFCKTRNQNMGEIFAISRNTKTKLGAQFCYFWRINSLHRTYQYVMYNCTYLSVVTFDRQGRVRSIE